MLPTNTFALLCRNDDGRTVDRKCSGVWLMCGNVATATLIGPVWSLSSNTAGPVPTKGSPSGWRECKKTWSEPLGF